MEIKTKFNIGDVVYFMESEVPIKSTICGISTYTGERLIHVNGGKEKWTDKGAIRITYHFIETGKVVDENDIYSTKEELQKSILSLVEERFESLS